MSDEKPLAAASKRMRKKRGPKLWRTTVNHETQVAGMTATGVPTGVQARTLAIDPATVKAIQRKPEVQKHIEELRLAVRLITSQRVNDHVEGLYEWIGNTIKDKADAKALSFLTKAAADMEKVSQGAGGEAQKVEVQSEHPQGDLKQMLAVWLKESH